MTALEIEVKFLIADPQDIRRRILSLGAESRGRVFESNATYDDDAQSLKHAGRLLRLRRTEAGHTLTLKAPAAVRDDDVKVMKELETGVSDPDALHALLEALGYRVRRRYEKWRETLHLGETLFCLDAMPFGDFLEIEGPARHIPSLSAALGLDWARRILVNYYGIFDILKAERRLPFEDISFERFRGLDVDLASLAERLYAG